MITRRDMARGVMLAMQAAFAFCLLTATLASAFTVPLQARQQQQAGTPLFLDEPSCNSYQCDIIWHPGDNVTAHWLDAPQGNVILSLLNNSNDQALAYNLSTVPGTTTNCNANGGTSCGQFSFLVASDWLGGNYTLEATSESDPSVQSYTDRILVQAGGNSAPVAYTPLDPTVSGTGTVAPPAAASSTSAPAASNSSAAAPAAGSSSASSAPSSGHNAGGRSASMSSGLQMGVAFVAALTLGAAMVI